MRVVFGGLLGMLLLAASAVASNIPFHWRATSLPPSASSVTKTRAKGKAVHTVTGKGCLSCHEVRVAKDVTRVKLITRDAASKLCLTCHTKLDAAQVKGHMHSPAIRDCPEMPRSAYLRQ